MRVLKEQQATDYLQRIQATLRNPNQTDSNIHADIYTDLVSSELLSGMVGLEIAKLKTLQETEPADALITIGDSGFPETESWYSDIHDSFQILNENTKGRKRSLISLINKLATGQFNATNPDVEAVRQSLTNQLKLDPTTQSHLSNLKELFSKPKYDSKNHQIRPTDELPGFFKIHNRYGDFFYKFVDRGAIKREVKFPKKTLTTAFLVSGYLTGSAQEMSQVVLTPEFYDRKAAHNQGRISILAVEDVKAVENHINILEPSLRSCYLGLDFNDLTAVGPQKLLIYFLNAEDARLRFWEAFSAASQDNSQLDGGQFAQAVTLFQDRFKQIMEELPDDRSRVQLQIVINNNMTKLKNNHLHQLSLPAGEAVGLLPAFSSRIGQKLLSWRTPGPNTQRGGGEEE